MTEYSCLDDRTPICVAQITSAVRPPSNGSLVELSVMDRIE